MSDCPSDLEWLGEIIDRRAEIQRLSFYLLKLLQNRKPPESDNKVAQLLVGASFSLWRAVFLLDADRGSGDIETKAEEFLKTLLQDNAITYPFERNMKSWSVGYYLNNARHRIERIASEDGYKDTLTRDLPDSITEGELVEIWDVYFRLLKEQLSRFGERVSADSVIDETSDNTQK